MAIDPLLPIIFLIPITIVCAEYTSQSLQTHDHKAIVSDEIIGMMICLYITSSINLYQYSLAFILFRLFDIFKPWPISVFDKKIKGGLGVTLDDIIAALIASGLILLINNNI